MKKGRMIYVPPLVLVELDDIMQKEKIHKRAEAFSEFTNYAKVGRAVKNLTGVNFSEIIFKQKKKRVFF